MTDNETEVKIQQFHIECSCVFCRLEMEKETILAASNADKIVYVVGEYGGKDAMWCIKGIFSTKEKALECATGKADFIGPLEMDKDHGTEKHEWLDCYYPNANTGR